MTPHAKLTMLPQHGRGGEGVGDDGSQGWLGELVGAAVARRRRRQPLVGPAVPLLPQCLGDWQGRSGAI